MSVALLLSASVFAPAKASGTSDAKRASSAAGSAAAAGQMKNVGRSQNGGLGVKGPAPAEPEETRSCYKSVTLDGKTRRYAAGQMKNVECFQNGGMNSPAPAEPTDTCNSFSGVLWSPNSQFSQQRKVIGALRVQV